MIVLIKNTNLKNAVLNPFTPTKISNCILWADGSDESSIKKDISNKVSQWDDKSGAANHLIQGTGSDQPLYIPTGLNNKGILSFDGINDFLFHNNFQIGSHLTLYVVTKPIIPFYGFLIEQSININSFDGFLFYGFGSPPAWVRNNNQHLTAPSNFNWIGSAPVIGHMKYDGNLLAYYKNNILKGSKIGTIPNNTVTDILRINKHATTLHIKTRIAEIIIYNRALNQDENDKIYYYLNKKWAIF